jgi:C4-dicarboxylate transporter DctQ subunit
MKVVNWLDKHFEEAFLVVCLVLISCVMMLQVIVRKIPGVQPLKWAEEFCRFMWIMSVFFSLAYTIRNSCMLRVSVVIDLFPETIRKVVNILVDFVVAAMMGLMAYNSVGVFNKILASGELSPAMQWPMSFVYFFMLFGFILATVRGIQMMIIHIMHFGDKVATQLEQTIADAADEANAGKRAEGGK